MGRSIDARLAIAALKSAIRERDPPKGCIHHSDRGSQYASSDYRKLLTAHGLVGSMSRRGNPYDNAKAESFMKTLKVEVSDGLRNIRGRNRRSSPLPRRGLQSSEAPLCARLSKPRAVRRSPRPAEGQNRSLILSGLRGALHQGVKVARRNTHRRRRGLSWPPGTGFGKIALPPKAMIY